MDLKNLVPSLETCQKLVGCGWKEKAFIFWVQMEDGSYEANFIDDLDSYKGVPLIPAPTASELGEEFKKVSKIEIGKTYYYAQFFSANIEWMVCYQRKLKDAIDFQHENEAECRAQLIIWLVENKHIEL